VIDSLYGLGRELENQALEKRQFDTGFTPSLLQLWLQ